MPLKSWSEMMKDAETNTSGFQPLEEGSYTFVIEAPAKVGETSKKNPKFSINPTVESGPRAKARIFHDFNVSDSAYAMREFFFKPLYAIGLSPSFFETNPTNEQIAAAFQGKRFSARVELETGTDGVKRPRLVDFSAPSGAAPASGPGVPTGLAPAPSTPSAPSAPAAPAAPQAAAPQAAAVTPAPAPQAPVDDGNPWATTPPPPPVF